MLKEAKRKPDPLLPQRKGGASSTRAAPPERPTRSVPLTFGLALAGAMLLWAAFPPLNLPWLAWVATLPWLWLIRGPALPGRRPYLALWLAGSAFWLAMLYGIRMAHPALNVGWVVLSVYLGVYLPLFVGLSRVAVHQLRVSIVVAAPVVWVGLELIRGYFLTGFSLGLLAHTQAEFPRLIQIADLAGGYTLSFVIMLVAACTAEMFSTAGNPPSWERASLARIAWWPALPAAAAVGATLLYGGWRLNEPVPTKDRPAIRAALIQGSLDTVFLPPEKISEQIAKTFDHYGHLTNQAVNQQPDLDLVVWPESMFMIPERLIQEPLAEIPGSGRSVEQIRAALQASQAEFAAIVAGEAGRANQNTAAGRETRLLVGATSLTYGPRLPQNYNAALLADRSGQIVGRYYKTHAVMFGEYIPFADWIPYLDVISPIHSMSTGQRPEVFDVGGLKLSPSICFESTVPHLIRGQVVELERRGTPADVLVNLTNDGWFWGSSILDLHLRCGVFRAVENRKPLIVAANTGIASHVDGNGVIRQRGAKREPQAVIAEVRADGRSSLYHTIGDWPAWVLGLGCFALAAIGWRGITRKNLTAEPRQE